MRISICGLGTLMTMHGVPTIAYRPDEIKHYESEAWKALHAVELENDSVVEIVATITTNKESIKQPYAIIVSEEGVEKNHQIQAVIEHLLLIGLDVEIPRKIYFWHKK